MSATARARLRARSAWVVVVVAGLAQACVSMPDHGATAQAPVAAISASEAAVRFPGGEFRAALFTVAGTTMSCWPPERDGDMRVAWHVGDDGTVGEARVLESTLSSRAETCVLEAVRSIRLPQPVGGGFDFVWPFHVHLRPM